MNTNGPRIEIAGSYKEIMEPIPPLSNLDPFGLNKSDRNQKVLLAKIPNTFELHVEHVNKGFQMSFGAAKTADMQKWDLEWASAGRAKCKELPRKAKDFR